uniref:Uncharacterized protein n=1 Tax=Chenopodium quinoa TaxID=63459 RepID=A0A803L632_CHEQI
MSAAKVEHISECFIKPKYEVEEAKKPYYLAPMDLAMPLVTQVDEDQHQCLVFVDCNKGPGARLIHATLDMTVSDILSPTDVPLVVQSFFDHDRAVNHDGHNASLLTIQVTELVDGIFIGCSMNHALGDGTSYWLFWNMWSEIHRSKHEELVPVSRMPVLERWFPKGYGPTLYLPYVHPDEFVTRHEAPRLRERIFHFSAKSMARLKAKANEEYFGNNTSKISSFQALSALCWRTIVRANGLAHDQVTNCRLATNNRHRLDPPLPPEYFGNCISAMPTPTTVGELLDNNLG